jgi:hypothetical protein
MHSPEHAEEMQEARRLGGLHRRRESTLVAVYDIGALDTVPGIRRILEIALIQGLGIENSVGRSRMLIAGAMALAKLLQFGEHEDRLQAIEQVLHSELKGRRR